MRPKVGRWQRVVGLVIACLGLMPLSPLSAQQPKLRDTLKGHTGHVHSVAFSPDSRSLAAGTSGGVRNRRGAMPLAQTAKLNNTAIRQGRTCGIRCLLLVLSWHSSRFTMTSGGAFTPIRTRPPLISRTVTVTLSPITTVSVGRRVKMSMFHCLLTLITSMAPNQHYSV